MVYLFALCQHRLMIDVVRGVQRGAQGVGLYRSEIPFMLRERFPGEEEQRAIYRQQLSHFANKPVVCVPRYWCR
jgi:phosphotransferase system enzyme I (PtsP)